MKILEAQSGEPLRAVAQLFENYQAFLGVNLCFQGFADELAQLPGKYAKPEGNLYVLQEGESYVGCVAFYHMGDGVCELKRLYVVPTAWGKGYGKALLERAVHDAKALGYHLMRLDSLKRLESAAQLYEAFGFVYCEPYNINPEPDVYYMQKPLI